MREGRLGIDMDKIIGLLGLLGLNVRVKFRARIRVRVRVRVRMPWCRQDKQLGHCRLCGLT